MTKCLICRSINTYKILTSFNVHGSQILDKKEKFDIYKCNNCSGMFLKNVEDYEKYYKEDYFKNSLKTDNWFFRTLVKVSERYSFRSKERLILSYLGKNFSKVKILDIGCGEGKFLENLDQNIFEKKGVEISKKASNVCNKKGLVVINNGFLEAEFGKEKYDVITMWHVLEHLKNPIAVFKKINDLLKEGGILLVSTPNTNSLGFKIGKENWFHLDTPRHLTLYCYKSFGYLCLKTNLELVMVSNEFCDYYTDLFWSLRKFKWKLLLYLFYPIVKLFSKETLTFVCQKN